MSKTQLPESIEILQVANGWLVFPSRNEATFRGGTMHPHTRVARTPEELVHIIYQWTSGDPAMGLPVPEPDYSSLLQRAQAQAMVAAVAQPSALAQALAAPIQDGRIGFGAGKGA